MRAGQQLRILGAFSTDLSRQRGISPRLSWRKRPQRTFFLSAFRTAQSLRHIFQPRIPAAYPTQRVRFGRSLMAACLTSQDQAVLTELVAELFDTDVASHVADCCDGARARPSSSGIAAVLYANPTVGNVMIRAAAAKAIRYAMIAASASLRSTPIKLARADVALMSLIPVILPPVSPEHGSYVKVAALRLPLQSSLAPRSAAPLRPEALASAWLCAR